MSLILDALRKLEREKDPRAPGVLVVGSVPWGETSRARRVVVARLAVGALALAAGVGWLLRATPAPPAAPPPPVTTPTLAARPAPIPTPLPAAPPTVIAPQATLPAAPPIRISRAPATPPDDRPREAAEAATGETASDPAPAALPAAPAAAEPAPERISVTPAAQEADPTLPAPAPGTLRLNAITKRDGRSVALINDRMVFEGDSFDGVRVIRIGEAEVEVEVRGERRILRF